MLAGGSYHEVARWLANFLVSHAKREHARAEVLFEADDEAAGRYVARLRVGERVSAPREFAYPEVAARRGSLAWCAALAADTRARVRDLLTDQPASDVRAG